jgi:ATP-binding cassette subfamily B protein RaxB
VDGGSSPGFAASFARRSLSLVMQSEQAECGLACLAMVARYHGHDVDLMSLRRRFSTSLKGVTLARLVDIAGALGFDARPLRLELGSLRELRVPCILHWNLNHFVVLRRMTRNAAEIYDPASGVCRVPLDEVSKRFSGVALELAPRADFTPIADVQRISLRTLAGQIAGLRPALVQMFGLALALEILILMLPFQIQWVIDQVLVTSDRSLLVTIGLGFLLIVAAQTGLALGRGAVITWLGASLSAQWTTNLFGHLLRLPLDYFEKRHMGDVLSRFTSLNAIQATLTGSFVESLLDGLMGICALVILACYSVPLTSVALATFAVYALLRFAFYRKLWLINEEQLVFASRQQSELMESVRGVQAIKLANKHAQRRARVANATLDLAQRDMRKQRLTLAFNAASQGLFGVQRIALITWGAWICLNGTFSAGLLVAFLAYADQFATRLGALIDKLVDFRMLRLHAARIADIALATPERNAHGVHSGPAPAPGIALQNVSFRYAEDEPWIVRHLDMNIEAGESVAIVGPSGCGKSTLAKIMLGLLVPSEGTITIGGMDIRTFGLENYRAMIGAVMQDDQLFSGTIADNISFFDEGSDMPSIEVAARAAAIHDDIMAMPMGYETLVGDMGSSLSGGQRQRVIFARALYRKPKILMLDEATSHLDIDCERSINRCVGALNITRIIIAHRPETIAIADRVVELWRTR